MKAYGIPRWMDVAWPDVADIRIFALKTSIGGKARGYHRNKAVKRATRRYFKHCARLEGKAACVVKDSE